MTAGFLTIANSHYLPLSKVLVQGLLRFSQQPIHVVTINCDYRDYGWTNERIKQSCLEVPDVTRKRCCFAKITALLTSPFEHTVYLDADSVPNQNVDDLIELAKRWDSPMPICPIHPVPPGPHQPLLESFGLEQQPDIFWQTCLMLLGPTAKAWLAANWAKAEEVIAKLGEHSLPGGEEYPLNCLLWQANCTQALNYCCPKFGAYHTYAIGDEREMNSIYEGHQVSWQVFHNNKDAREAETMLGDITTHEKEFVTRHNHRRRKPYVLSF